MKLTQDDVGNLVFVIALGTFAILTVISYLL